MKGLRSLPGLVALLACGSRAIAQDGNFDAEFGTGGLVEIALPSKFAEARSVAIDGQGRIVVAGDAAGTGGDLDFSLFRLGPDGSLDPAYAADTGGFRLVDFDLDGIGGDSDDLAQAVRVLADDSIVAVGEAHFGLDAFNSQYALVRTDADGALDTGFAHGGTAHFGFDTFTNLDRGSLLAVDASGRFVLAGTVTFGDPVSVWAGLARLTPQGSLDATFYGQGRFRAPLYGDQSTDPPTIATDNLPSALIFDAAGGIVIAGTFFEPFAPDVAVMRTDTDGKYDASFGPQGTGRMRLQLANAFAADVVALPQRKLMVGGIYGVPGTPFLFRLNEDGSPDPGFGTDGLASGAPLDAGHFAELNFLARTRAGGWMLAGRYGIDDGQFGAPIGVIVVRFRADGSVDSAFGTNGIGTFVPDAGGRRFEAFRSALQPDGKLVVAGALPQTAAGNDSTRNFAVLRILVDTDTVFVDGFEAPD